MSTHRSPSQPTAQRPATAPAVAVGCMWRAALLVCASALPLSAAAERLLGFVRDAQSQRYLYTEVHDLVRAADGSVQTGVTVYFDAQGKEMARKTLDYRANRTVPVYRLDVPAQQYSEGISGNTGNALAFKVDQGKEERKSLPLNEGLTAADAGFNQLLIDNWGPIKRGETLKFNLIAAGRTSSFSFRARKMDDVTVNGVAAIKVLVEPDSMLRFVVSPIELTYDSKGSALLGYKGVSNILDPDTGKVYKLIQITYGGNPPAEAKWPGGK